MPRDWRVRPFRRWREAASGGSRQWRGGSSRERGCKKPFAAFRLEEIAEVRVEPCADCESRADKAIHEARQAFKRLRALIRLAKPRSAPTLPQRTAAGAMPGSFSPVRATRPCCCRASIRLLPNARADIPAARWSSACVRGLPDNGRRTARRDRGKAAAGYSRCSTRPKPPSPSSTGRAARVRCSAASSAGAEAAAARLEGGVRGARIRALPLLAEAR